MITGDSYFQKNAEFREWLEHEHALVFGDLKTDEARKIFSEFVEAWNKKTLPKRLYSGIAPSATNRTSHKWGLNGKC